MPHSNPTSLLEEWFTSPRWRGVRRDYSADDVLRLRPSVLVEHTLARVGAERLWRLLAERDHLPALGAMTGGQAVQMARAGLEAIYLSGWQVAADANLAEQVYPDQSLYPANSVPAVVRRINNALLRAEQVARVEGEDRGYLVPIVADAEAGFGGPLNAYELTSALIAAGAAGIHFEDQLASEKKCGHLGGKVLVPTGQFIRTLQAALLTTDVDDRDRPFLTGERTAEGYFRVRAGLEAPIARALAYAPYADLLWCETSTPDLEQARAFAEAVHARFPGKLLAYNCSPSFNWRRHLDDQTIARFQKELAAMGYRFQFITLAGFHSLNAAAFELASGYAAEGMTAYVRLQQHELALESQGYSATRHQREVGTGVFDAIAGAISGGQASTLALAGSTERQQF